jgi:hypothetical protein
MRHRVGMPLPLLWRRGLTGKKETTHLGQTSFERAKTANDQTSGFLFLKVELFRLSRVVRC